MGLSRTSWVRLHMWTHPRDLVHNHLSQMLRLSISRLVGEAGVRRSLTCRVVRGDRNTRKCQMRERLGLKIAIRAGLCLYSRGTAGEVMLRGWLNSLKGRRHSSQKYSKTNVHWYIWPLRLSRLKFWRSSLPLSHLIMITITFCILRADLS